jgi:catechol 2,3-dioxygenase-like lactoylglutathione lyase family enzyme
MKTLAVFAAAVLLASGFAHAQAPAAPAPTGPKPTGLIVGSGNYFSPIVHDLDAAIAFYRDGLGLEIAGQPGNADQNAPLRDMFGLPDAKLRWAIARTPAAPGGVEIIEISGAGGKALDRKLEDTGAVSFVVTVRDLDGTLARLTKLGAPVVTVGGKPVTIGAGTRIVIVKDPDGHFVELSQPAELPATTAPATANVIAVRVRYAVDDVEKTTHLYRDELGLQERAPTAAFGDNPTVLAALGMQKGQYRVAQNTVPVSGLMYDFVGFKDAGSHKVPGRLQDFGSTRVQIRVRDIDAAIAAFKKYGGEVVSTGGKTVALPAGNSTLKVAIVRDPNNLFVVLIESPPPAG